MKIVPYCYAKNIFDIDVSFYEKQNIKYIFCDLDNTLDTYKTLTPSERVIDLSNRLKEKGIKLIVVSNNNKNRVSTYCKDLEIEFIHRAFKPFVKKLNNFIIKNKIDKKQCIIIGDQLFTDIKVASKLKIRSILTEELCKKNQLISLFNKIRDQKARKKLIKENKLIDWRKLNG